MNGQGVVAKKRNGHQTINTIPKFGPYPFPPKVSDDNFFHYRIDKFIF